MFFFYFFYLLNLLGCLFEDMIWSKAIGSDVCVGNGGRDGGGGGDTGSDLISLLLLVNSIEVI